MKSEMTRDISGADSSRTRAVVLAWPEKRRAEPAFDEDYLAGLRSGDRETTRHFERHFRLLLRLKLWGRVNGKREETLIDDVIAAATEGVRREELRNPLFLPAYVCAVCTRLVNSRREMFGV